MLTLKLLEIFSVDWNWQKLKIERFFFVRCKTSHSVDFFRKVPSLLHCLDSPSHPLLAMPLMLTTIYTYVSNLVLIHPECAHNILKICSFFVDMLWKFLQSAFNRQVVADLFSTSFLVYWIHMYILVDYNNYL